MRNNAPEYRQHERQGLWRNNNAAGGLHVLTHDDFGQLPLATFYDDIAKAYGRDFSNIRFVSQYMPLFHDGTRHKKLRKIAAMYLKDIADDLNDFEQNAAQMVESLFLQKGEHELIAELIIPLIKRLAYGLTKVEYCPGLIAMLAGNNSLKATLDIEEAIGRINAQAKACFPNESEEWRGIRLAFAALGVEPLGATIARSFNAMFTGLKNHPLASLDWPPHFTAAGLTSVLKQCKNRPFGLGPSAQDMTFFEVDLQVFINEEGANNNHIFGAGSHGCLGRGLSLSLWARIVKSMKNNPMHITHVDSAPPKHKFLNFPSSLNIEVI